MPKTKNLFQALAGVVASAPATPAPKQANAFTVQDEVPVVNLALQAVVGDADTEPLSWMAQTKPSSGGSLPYDANSPLGGDEVFFAYLFDGARFADKNGDWWDIVNYDFEGAVTIQKVWYPAIQGIVSIQDIRRSIHAWIAPVYQRIPDAPQGVDYGVVVTRPA